MIPGWSLFFALNVLIAYDLFEEDYDNFILLYVLSLVNRITARQILAPERFIITLYGRYLTASLSSAVPWHDLQLRYDLQM